MSPSFTMLIPRRSRLSDSVMVNCSLRILHRSSIRDWCVAAMAKDNFLGVWAELVEETRVEGGSFVSVGDEVGTQCVVECLAPRWSVASTNTFPSLTSTITCAKEVLQSTKTG
jgi:hypothetical protein